jgi:hypothetical protein
MYVKTEDKNKTFVSLDQRWGTSGFQQLMTTATKAVLDAISDYDNGTKSPAEFSVAYLPMNTGEFEYS